MASRKIFQFPQADFYQGSGSVRFIPKKSFLTTVESALQPLHQLTSEISVRGMANSQGISKYSVQHLSAKPVAPALTVDTDLPSDVGAACQALGMEAWPVKRLPAPKTLLSLQSSVSSPLKTQWTPCASQRLLRVRRPSFYQLPAKEPSTGSSILSMSFTVIGEVHKAIGQTPASLENTSQRDLSQQQHCVEECSLNDHTSAGKVGTHRRASLRKALTSKSRDSKNANSRDQSLQPDLIYKDLLNMDLNGRLVIDLEHMRRSGAQAAKTGPLDVSAMSSQSKAVSVRSILVRREKSERELRRNDTDSPKKKVVFAKNKMVMLFEKEKKEKSSR